MAARWSKVKVVGSWSDGEQGIDLAIVKALRLAVLRKLTAAIEFEPGEDLARHP